MHYTDLQPSLLSFQCHSLLVFESLDLTKCWCRRESVRAPPQVKHTSPVRRSRRRCLRITRLGVQEEDLEMPGEEASATTQTSDEYSPGELSLSFIS